jgi:16S rRNA (cytosine967-C5)-methyltransferase
MHFDSYIRSAETIISNYDGKLPFAAWLKNFFRENKKYGSRDRKFITRFCYAYFRSGKAFSSASFTEKICIAEFLTNTGSSPLLEVLNPEFNNIISKTIEEKLAFLDAGEEWKNIFPLTGEISEEIDVLKFSLSHLQQPDVFLRIRPGHEIPVRNKLTNANIAFNQYGEDCLSVAAGSPVDAVLDIDKEVVVQDINSQRTILPLLPYITNLKTSWDCCAASGGKSILLHDRSPGIYLTLSDIRQSIIYNLRSRFARAGIERYKSFVGDLTLPGFSIKEKFDLIICDAPCSGSGTWGRTPEQLSFFDGSKIGHYASLQRSIASKASEQLKPGGFLLYITCSVFRNENEDVVDHLKAKTALKLVSMQYLKGYEIKADTLFGALFQL